MDFDQTFEQFVKEVKRLRQRVGSGEPVFNCHYCGLEIKSSEHGQLITERRVAEEARAWTELQKRLDEIAARSDRRG
jgi:hypothetical protein